MDLDYLMVSEAARILERSSDSVRSYNGRGLLKAIRIAGGVRLFRRQDVITLKERLHGQQQGQYAHRSTR